MGESEEGNFFPCLFRLVLCLCLSGLIIEGLRCDVSKLKVTGSSPHITEASFLFFNLYVFLHFLLFLLIVVYIILMLLSCKHVQFNENLL